MRMPAITGRLDQAVRTLQSTAGEDAAATLYYAAAAQLLHGNLPQAMVLAERGIGFHPDYAALYDLAGATYTKLGQVFRARWAFDQSLRFDAHDSTAYEESRRTGVRGGEFAGGAQLLRRSPLAEPKLRGGPAGRAAGDVGAPR